MSWKYWCKTWGCALWFLLRCGQSASSDFSFFIKKDEVSVGPCFLICRQEYLLFYLPRLTKFLVRRRLSRGAPEPLVCAISSILASFDAREVLEGLFFFFFFPLAYLSLAATCLFRAAHLVCLLLSSERDKHVLCMVSGREDEGTLSPREVCSIICLLICSPVGGEYEELEEQSLFSASVLGPLFSLAKILWDVNQELFFWRWNAADNLGWFCV